MELRKAERTGNEVQKKRSLIMKMAKEVGKKAYGSGAVFNAKMTVPTNPETWEAYSAIADMFGKVAVKIDKTYKVGVVREEIEAEATKAWFATYGEPSEIYTKPYKAKEAPRNTVSFGPSDLFIRAASLDSAHLSILKQQFAPSDLFIKAGKEFNDFWSKEKFVSADTLAMVAKITDDVAVKEFAEKHPKVRTTFGFKASLVKAAKKIISDSPEKELELKTTAAYDLQKQLIDKGIRITTQLSFILLNSALAKRSKKIDEMTPLEREQLIKDITVMDAAKWSTMFNCGTPATQPPAGQEHFDKE
jgi:hypothetical protein